MGQNQLEEINIPDELPANVEAEQEILGAILVNNDALYKVQSFLEPEHFSEGLHQRLYAACRALSDQGAKVDPIQLQTQFEKDPDIDDVGGTDYIFRLQRSVVSIINAVDYAKTIHGLWQRRVLIESCNWASEQAMAMEPTESLVKALEDDLSLIAGQETGQYTRLLSEAVDSALNQFEAATLSGGVMGLSTGLKDLDAMLGGLINKRLYVPAGRPGMAKSILAINLALNVSRQGKNVLMMSPEMGAEEVSARAMASTNENKRVEYQAMERGKASIDDLKSLRLQMEDLPLYLNDSGSITIDDIVHEVRRLNRYLGTKGERIDLLIVDHIHKVRKRRREDNFEGISNIIGALKSLAKDCNMPVVAFAQLNRECEKRDNKRPLMSDLRGAGTIEEDADCIIFLYRDAFYYQKEKPSSISERKLWENEMAHKESEIELIIAKQRGGKTGTRKFHIDLGISKITDRI